MRIRIQLLIVMIVALLFSGPSTSFGQLTGVDYEPVPPAFLALEASGLLDVYPGLMEDGVFNLDFAQLRFDFDGNGVVGTGDVNALTGLFELAIEVPAPFGSAESFYDINKDEVVGEGDPYIPGSYGDASALIDIVNAAYAQNIIDSCGCLFRNELWCTARIDCNNSGTIELFDTIPNEDREAPAPTDDRTDFLIILDHMDDPKYASNATRDNGDINFDGTVDIEDAVVFAQTYNDFYPGH